MQTLPHRHLTTLTLVVDFAGVLAVGQVREGFRGLAQITGGTFAGAVLAGRVIGGHDRFTRRPDGTLMIDVRLALETGDGAAILLSYQGHMLAPPEAMAKFRRGEILAGGYRLEIAARFETGDERYAWLNDAIVVGIGEQTATGPIYTLFEIGRT